ncbi:uncharacterized protein isoform X2 [Danio rerio]|uniref:Uncharacterized protein isoform X2 n=1 Tax=Danio rerio TaxID=7955 RepID=A0AC58J195_DANRE
MLVLFNFTYLKMHQPKIVLMSVILKIVDGLVVRGPSAPLSAPLGSSVVLPCYVDEALPVEDLEVEWRRADSETLIHLYQDGESRAEVQQQDYHDRAHFFTEEIQHGNFSLRLDNLTAQDEGEYRCRVHSQQDSGETVAEIKNIERLLVSGPEKLVSAYVDGDVTLNCSVDSHITPEHIEEVSWRKTDKDGDITVLLYQKNKTVSEATHEEFRGRVEFFTAEIPKGNFSLRLKSVRTEDKGVYMCQVFAGVLSANATVQLERLGFSALHTMTVILCISASGSALLLCFLIYSPDKETLIGLQMFLLFFPNILMCLAFLLWGLTEDEITRWIMKYSYVAEYGFLSAAVYSALLVSTWQRIMGFAEFDRVLILVMFVIVFLPCFCKVVYFLVAEVGKKSGLVIKIFDAVALMTFEILPTLQFMLLFYTFGSVRTGLIVVIILPLLMMMMNERMFVIFKFRLECSESIMRAVMLTLTIVTNAVMIGFYIFSLDDKTDAVGWGCVLVLLQILWIIIKFTDITFSDSIRLSRGFPRVVAVYVFGSVGIVLLNSVTLMTELILKTVTGVRSIADLRFIAFLSECLFALILLISGLFPSKIKKFLEFCQNPGKCKKCPIRRSQQNQNTTQTQDAILLRTEDQGENQPGSVETPT